jgi:hypothetical protein
MTVNDDAPPAPAVLHQAVLRRWFVESWEPPSGSGRIGRRWCRGPSGGGAHYSYPAPSGEYDSAATLSYAYSSALPTRHCSRGIVASLFGQAVAQLDAGHGQARLSVVVATLGLPSRGDVVAALREAVQPLKRRGEVINEGQPALGVTHRQQAPHRMAADNHPVDIAAHAAHADVVEGGEGLGAEEVDSACTIRRPHSDFSNVTCRSVVVAS